MLLDIEFEDGDCIGIPTLFEKHVTEPIESAFGEIIILGIRALEFAVLGDGGVGATSHYSHAEVMDERSFRLGRLLAIKDGANPLGHFAQVRPRSVVEDDDEVMIADEALFEGVEAVYAAAVGDHGLSGTRFTGGDAANVPAVSVVFQIRSEEFLLEIVGNKFFGVESLIPPIEIFDGGIKGTGGKGQGHF